MVDRAIWIGANGAIAQQFGLDVLSNNIANINTVGYRAQRPTFSDIFHRTDRLATETTNPVQTGHGTDIGSIDTVFRQGETKPSQTFTDVAVAGDGFFVLRDPRLPVALRTFYTRAGNFTIDSGIASSGSGNPFSSGGQVLFLRDLPEYTTLPRLIDPATGRIVQGYLANSDGVVQTTVTDLTIDPKTKDPAKETTGITVGGNLDGAIPDYDMSLMKDASNGQLATLTGEFNQNQDRGLLTVTWLADGSGSWNFLKSGQTVPDPFNSVSFLAGTVKKNSTNDVVPGIKFRTRDVTSLAAGSFTALVGPFNIKSNSSQVATVEGAYLGNLNDGTLNIATASTGAVSWTFVPKGKNFISESGSGTFAAADSAISTIIPGITLKKPAGTSLGAGTLVVETDHADDAASAINPLFDDATPSTQHTLITTFKAVAQNEYGVMATGQTSEKFSDSAIATLSNGQRRLTTYANIDQNQVTLRRVVDNTTLILASSKVASDLGNNINAASVRGAYWSSISDLNGTVSLTLDATAGSGTWSFTPAAQTQATATGTIAAGTLRANTAYGLGAAGGEVIPGLIFTTGSALTSGTVTFDTTIGAYNTNNNQITFSPSFSNKINSLTSFIADYKFASSVFTNASATTGTPLYRGTVAFDSNRQFHSGTSSVPDITLTPSSTVTDTVSITPNLTALQLAFGAPAVHVSAYDGNLEGFLTSLEFNEQGKLNGVFSNSKEKPLAQLVLATFRNSGGLSRAGDTAFLQTIASGEPVVQSVEQLPAGTAKILPFRLEYSNSNLEDELTDLIFFQRAFQFNSRSIRAADELIQTAIGLKRA